MAEKKIKKKKQVKKSTGKPLRVVEKKEKPKRKIPVRKVIVSLTMMLIIFIALTAGYYYITANYKVTTVYVEGNVHYSNEEIMEMVMKGRYGHNSLFLSLKYKDKSIGDIPFIEKIHHKM